MRARVHITLKAGVLDPQGKAVAQALAALGFYFQYTQWFSPPFVVQLLLWPLEMIEYGLLYAVTTSKEPAA